MSEISLIIEACKKNGNFSFGYNQHKIFIREGDLFAKSMVKNIIQPITMSPDCCEQWIKDIKNSCNFAINQLLKT